MAADQPAGVVGRSLFVVEESLVHRTSSESSANEIAVLASVSKLRRRLRRTLRRISGASLNMWSKPMLRNRVRRGQTFRRLYVYGGVNMYEAMKERLRKKTDHESTRIHTNHHEWISGLLKIRVDS